MKPTFCRKDGRDLFEVPRALKSYANYVEATQILSEMVNLVARQLQYSTLLLGARASLTLPTRSYCRLISFQ